MFTDSWKSKLAGSTVSIAIIRNDKIFIGHVGDSRIVLGYQKGAGADWQACALTTDHKPDAPAEQTRIVKCGGRVFRQNGVRVTRIKARTGR